MKSKTNNIGVSIKANKLISNYAQSIEDYAYASEVATSDEQTVKSFMKMEKKSKLLYDYISELELNQKQTKQ